MYKNTQNNYGIIAKVLHWGMVPLFIGMFLLAYIMMDMTAGDTKWMLYGLHKSIGVILLFLIVFRFAWRLAGDVPTLPNETPDWQKKAAHTNILLLYAMMFGMALSGVTMSLLGGHDITVFNLFKISSPYLNKDLASVAHSAHGYISYVFIASFTLHVLGALYHHYILKDSVLTRMWFGTRKKTS